MLWGVTYCIAQVNKIHSVSFTYAIVARFKYMSFKNKMYSIRIRTMALKQECRESHFYDKSDFLRLAAPVVKNLAITWRWVREDTNNNNNNIHICIAPYGRNFRGAGPGSVLVVHVRAFVASRVDGCNTMLAGSSNTWPDELYVTAFKVPLVSRLVVKSSKFKSKSKSQK